MRIGVDVDSVLADIMQPLVDYFNRKHNTDFTLEDTAVTRLNEVWGISFDEAIITVNEFFVDCWDEIMPIPGSVEGIRRLKDEGHELSIITARPEFTKERTIEWIKEIYGETTFGEMFFTDRFRKPDAPKKSRIMVENDIDLLIDDEPSNYMECVNDGVSCILLNADNKFPWARIKDHEYIRALSWDEAVKKVDELILVRNT